LISAHRTGVPSVTGPPQGSAAFAFPGACRGVFSGSGVCAGFGAALGGVLGAGLGAASLGDGDGDGAGSVVAGADGDGVSVAIAADCGAVRRAAATATPASI
jgi:hypothetical protein